MNDAALIFLCAAMLVVAVALYASNRSIRCVRCGRNCAGRAAGGTVDRPVCARCVDQPPGASHRP